MWWDRSEAVEVYLGQTLVGVRGLDAAGSRWEAITRVDEGVACLERWLSQERKRRRVRIWLASALARPFVIAADCGARNSAEIAALGTSAAAERTGLEEELKVWTARWRADRPTLAVAVPRELWERLCAPERRTVKSTSRIDSVRPWWNPTMDARLDRSRADAKAIAWTVAEPDGLMLGRANQGDVVEASFEPRRSTDADWTLLRRRLAIAWQGVEKVEHVVFACESGQSDLAIGVAVPQAETGPTA